MRVVEALFGPLYDYVPPFRVPGRIGADELVANSQLSGRCLKEGFQIAPATRKAVGELKTVIGLNTLDGNAFAGKCLTTLLRKSAEEKVLCSS